MNFILKGSGATPYMIKLLKNNNNKQKYEEINDYSVDLDFSIKILENCDRIEVMWKLLENIL